MGRKETITGIRAEKCMYVCVCGGGGGGWGGWRVRVTVCLGCRREWGSV